VSALTLVEPAWCHIPSYDYTDGDQVADLCAQAGYGPDGEQRLCLDAIFGRDRFGRSVAYETVLIGARQNFKTAVEKQAALGWTFLFGDDPVVWTGQEWDVIAGHFHDLDQIISGAAFLRRQVRYVHRGERDQEIGLKSGARLLFKTRTPDGGAGLTGEKIILDEGWKVKNSHVSGLMPTLAARSMHGDPQVVTGSSAAHEESEVLHDLVRRGRAACSDPAVAAAESRLVYVEFCAPDPEVACARGVKCDHARETRGCGCDDPKCWQTANPAMGRRISMEHIATERRGWAPKVFGRERMGWHDKPAGDSVVIPLLQWAGAVDMESETDGGQVSLAVVFAGDRGAAAIGLAGWRPDGLWHVEVADYQGGTNWTIKRVVAICQRHDVVAVGISDKSHEESIAEDLRDALAEENLAAEVMILDASMVAQSYSLFFDAVTDDDATSLKHRSQDDLTLALAGATTRDIGDAGKAWGRKKSGVDISPVVAVSEAMYVQSVKAPYGAGEPGAWVILGGGALGAEAVAGVAAAGAVAGGGGAAGRARPDGGRAGAEEPARAGVGGTGPGRGADGAGRRGAGRDVVPGPDADRRGRGGGRVGAGAG